MSMARYRRAARTCMTFERPTMCARRSRPSTGQALSVGRPGPNLEWIQARVDPGSQLCLGTCDRESSQRVGDLLGDCPQHEQYREVDDGGHKRAEDRATGEKLD